MFQIKSVSHKHTHTHKAGIMESHRVPSHEADVTSCAALVLLPSAAATAAP